MLGRSIIAYSIIGAAVSGTQPFAVYCNDVFGNQGGDWLGGIGGQHGINGNICEDPLFCDLEGGDLRLDSSSPCLLAECGSMGAWPVGCPAASVASDIAGHGAISVVPNPTTGACRITPANWLPSLARVMDASGRCVRVLAPDAHRPGWRWDGLDEFGRRVACGVYRVRVEPANGRGAPATVLVVR